MERERERKKNLSDYRFLHPGSFFRIPSVYKFVAMILFILKSILLFHLIHVDGRNYNLFMPDLPPSGSSLSLPSITTSRTTHSFPSRSCTKLHLFNGPFHVRLYQIDTNYTSIEIETNQSIQEFLQVEIEDNNTLTIRMLKDFSIETKVNITILIIYQQINEILLDGLIDIECLNPIDTHSLRFHHHNTGTIQLKLNVHTFDAYLHSIGQIEFSGQVFNDTKIKSVAIGNIDCRKLLTRTIDILSSGIGNMYIIAIDEINIILNGIGVVYYSGPLKEQIQTGLGKIIFQSDLQINPLP